MTEQFEDSQAFAESLDQADPLARFRQRFNFPTWRKDHSPIYLCGNSLGLQSDLARSYVEQELDNWSNYAVPNGNDHRQVRLVPPGAGVGWPGWRGTCSGGLSPHPP